jgi:hypothetical protein
MNFIQLSSTDSLTLKISHLPFYSTPIMWLCKFCLGQIQVAFSSFFHEFAKITIQVCHKIFNSSVTVQSMACTVAAYLPSVPTGRDTPYDERTIWDGEAKSMVGEGAAWEFKVFQWFYVHDKILVASLYKSSCWVPRHWLFPYLNLYWTLYFLYIFW